MKCLKQFRALAPVQYAQSAIVFVAIGLASTATMAQSIVVASTTSTEQSGLFAHLLPEPIRKFTLPQHIQDAGHLSFVQGGGHGGSDLVDDHRRSRAMTKFTKPATALTETPMIINYTYSGGGTIEITADDISQIIDELPPNATLQQITDAVRSYISQAVDHSGNTVPPSLDFHCDDVCAAVRADCRLDGTALVPS